MTTGMQVMVKRLINIGPMTGLTNNLLYDSITMNPVALPLNAIIYGVFIRKLSDLTPAIAFSVGTSASTEYFSPMISGFSTSMLNSNGACYYSAGGLQIPANVSNNIIIRPLLTINGNIEVIIQYMCQEYIV